MRHPLNGWLPSAGCQRSRRLAWALCSLPLRPNNGSSPFRRSGPSAMLYWGRRPMSFCFSSMLSQHSRWSLRQSSSMPRRPPAPEIVGRGIHVVGTLQPVNCDGNFLDFWPVLSVEGHHRSAWLMTCANVSGQWLGTISTSGRAAANLWSPAMVAASSPALSAMSPPMRDGGRFSRTDCASQQLSATKKMGPRSVLASSPTWPRACPGSRTSSSEPSP